MGVTLKPLYMYSQGVVHPCYRGNSHTEGCSLSLSQVVQLKKDVHRRDFTIGQLKCRASAPSLSVASEVLYLRDQVASLERLGDTL